MYRAVLRFSGKAQRPLGYCAAPGYEKDRIDPVEPDAKLTLDKTLLAQFPEGYRHLAYLQSKFYTIKDELPGLDGPPLEALYAKGEAWLKGRKLSLEAGVGPQSRSAILQSKVVAHIERPGGSYYVACRQIQPV